MCVCVCGGGGGVRTPAPSGSAQGNVTVEQVRQGFYAIFSVYPVVTDLRLDILAGKESKKKAKDPITCTVKPVISGQSKRRPKSE